jgi:hypothetical protein
MEGAAREAVERGASRRAPEPAGPGSADEEALRALQPDRPSNGSGADRERPALRVLRDPRTVIALQRLAGHRAVARLLAESAGPRTQPLPRSPVVVQRLEPGNRPPRPGVGGSTTPGVAAAGPVVAPTEVTIGPRSSDKVSAPGGGADAPGGMGGPGAPPTGDAPGGGGAAAAPSAAPVSGVPRDDGAAPAGGPAAGGPGVAAGPEAGVAPPRTGTGVAVAGLEERAEARRQAVRGAAGARKEQMRGTATASAEALRLAAEQERQRALASIGASLDQVRQAFTTARDGINAGRRTSLDEVRTTARTRRGDLDRIVTEKKKALLDAAEENAKAALQAGIDEGNRALRESAPKAVRARQIGDEKVVQYKGYDRANRIARVAREMAGEAADQMTKEAQEVSAAVRKDGSDMAGKFRKEARDAAAKFDEARTAARKKIDDEETKAVDGIDKCADDAIAGLRTQSEKLTTELSSVRDASSGQLSQVGAVAGASMASQAVKAETALDAQTAQAEAAIGDFCEEVSTRLTGVAPSATGQVVDEADAHLGASLGEFDAAQQSQVTETVTAFNGAADAGRSRISAGVTQLVAPLGKVAVDFETTTADTMSKTNDTITTLAGTATGGMNTATKDVDTTLGQIVSDSDKGWKTQLDDGRKQMAKKVDDALASQDKALAGLGDKISEKAEEIEDEAWWERALSFVGGVIVGFFEELWDLVKGLLLVLLVILAIMLVIALVVVVILLVVKGLAALAVVAAFLAAVAAVAKVVLVVIAVVGVLVIAGVVGWRLYQAWVRDDLSDYERGKLVGRSITDILSVLLPGRALARIRGWIRLRQLARVVGGEARLVRLITWAGGDLVALERLAGELRSLDEFEILLTQTASLEEFANIRRLCNNNLGLTVRMLGRAGAGELIPAIAEFGNDVALLDRLATELGSLAEARRMLTLAGGDLARLRRWIAFFEGAGPMEAMYGIVGRDAALLDVLVTRTANRAEMARLMARIYNNGPLLRDLLIATDDVPQLDNMLTMLASDGVELRRLLTAAGGRPAAASVEQLMVLARSEGRPATNIQALITEAGNPARLLDLLGIARRFANRQRPPANVVPAPGYSGADLQHFLDGHTYSFFDFARVTFRGKTMWPPAGPGGDLARVQADLQATCTALRTPGVTGTRVNGGAVFNAPTTVTPPNVAPVGAAQVRGPVIVGQFQFGTEGAAQPFAVGQFFPRQVGGFEHHTEAVLRAIGQIMAIL